MLLHPDELLLKLVLCLLVALEAVVVDGVRDHMRTALGIHFFEHVDVLLVVRGGQVLVYALFVLLLLLGNFTLDVVGLVAI